MSTPKPKHPGPNQPKPNPSNPNPYNAPRATEVVGHQKSLRSPGLLEWIVVVVLGLIAGGFAFFTSCLGTAFAMVTVLGESRLLKDAVPVVFFVSICVGAVCGFFAVRLVVKLMSAQFQAKAERRESAGVEKNAQQSDGKDSEI